MNKKIVLIHNGKMMAPDLSMTSNKKALLTRKDPSREDIGAEEPTDNRDPRQEDGTRPVMTSNKKTMLTRKDLAEKTSEQKNPLITVIHGKRMTPGLSMTSNKKHADCGERPGRGRHRSRRTHR